MARKSVPRTPATRRVVKTEYIDEPEVEPPDDFGEFEDGGAGEAVRGILEGLGSGEIKIKISKYGPKGLAFCFATDGEIDEEFIQAQFGGGRYLGKIFVDGVFRKSFPLNIAERVSNGAVPGAAGSVADLQFRLMQQQIEMLKDILLQGRNQQQTPVLELAQALQALKAMETPGVGDKAIELFMRGIELGRSGGKDDDSWTSIVKEALPLVGGLMGKRAPSQQEAEPGGDKLMETRALPSGTADDNEAKLKAVIAYLKGKATLGVDPEFFIDWVAMNAEQPEYQQIIRFILASEFSAFTSLDEEIGKPPFVTFFRKLYDGLRSEFGGADNLGVDSGGTGGNRGNPGKDGKLSAVRQPKSGTG